MNPSTHTDRGTKIVHFPTYSPISMYVPGTWYAYPCENNNKSEEMPPDSTTDTNFNQHLGKKVEDNRDAKIMPAEGPGEPHVRNEEVRALRIKFPSKIPIIINRYAKESQLPSLDKSKYLVPQTITMSQFQTIIRNRMRMDSNQSLYLLVNNRSMLCLSLTLGEVYSEYAGPDGFLYITYASQEVFGSTNC